MYQQKIIFFIIHFYAIMHRTTIVQNSSICSCLLFCLDNIYRPSLGKLQLGRPNPKLIPQLNFYLRRRKKDNSIQNCMHYNGAEPDFQFSFSFIFDKILKIFIEKPVKILNNMHYNIIFLKIRLCSIVVTSLLMSTQLTSFRWIMNVCSGFETLKYNFWEYTF